MSNSGEVEAPAVAEQPAAEVPSSQTVEEAPKEEEKEKEVPVKEKKQRATKDKKPRQNKPKVPAHPPYFQMIKEAITELNEKGGSSPHAIAKYMEEKHKSVLPSNFKKILGLQLKNSAARGKLIKIKASYKLSEAGKKDNTNTTKAARANATKPKETGEKKRTRSKSVNKIEAAAAAAAAKPKAVVGRRTRKAASAPKPKVPKSIRSSVKRARKAAA